MKAQSLGDEWFSTVYPKIRDVLGYNQTRDEQSRDLLSTLLAKNKAPSFDLIQQLIQNKQILMLGAGPSLESDLSGLTKFMKECRPTLVAADGAADALYETGITPSIIVSDLDSCSLRSLEMCSREGYIFAHAHGDNMPLIEKVIPALGSNVFGTTQVSSVGNVTNFGGLTDGDRACFVISYFEPSSIIIAGMDFGTSEGSYSKNKYSSGDNPLRPTKLSLGRESLEFLIRSQPKIKFLNVTKFGEEIRGAPKVEYSTIT
ncbi:MAG: 6-hydroxymethylpterin diphosphokinase MptE-like protein [Nitrososphaerales archaeon]